MKSFNEFLQNKRNIFETHHSDESQRDVDKSERLADKSEKENLEFVKSIRTSPESRKKTKSPSPMEHKYLRAEIYKNKELNEFIVKFYLQKGTFFVTDLKYIGKKHDYHTKDLQDAISKSTKIVNNYF
jgi:hypothetical protein